MVGGNAPLSWLEATLSTSRGLAAVNTSGISPVKLLLPAKASETDETYLAGVGQCGYGTPGHIPAHVLPYSKQIRVERNQILWPK